VPRMPGLVATSPSLALPLTLQGSTNQGGPGKGREGSELTAWVDVTSAKTGTWPPLENTGPCRLAPA
jgi:hypothetical protein